MNLWDFGGQDVYHGSHALFLDGHAVFLVLWHPDSESAAPGEPGVTAAHRPLAYWLDYVRAEAGPDAVVLVVQARCDARGDEKPPPPVDLGDSGRDLPDKQADQSKDVADPDIRPAVRDVHRDPLAASRQHQRVLTIEVEQPSRQEAPFRLLRGRILASQESPTRRRPRPA